MKFKLENEIIKNTGYSEEEVVNIITNIIKMLAHRFVFGYYDLEDIKQHGFMEGIKALPLYRPALDDSGAITQPLEKFLYRHIYNRYLNLRRDKYRRSDVPCNLCHHGKHAEHKDGEICKRYADWKKRNHRKSNLVSPDKSIDNYDSFADKRSITDSAENQLILKESLEIIDKKLPSELRSSYLKMRAGVSVPKNKRLKVIAFIKEILS